LKRDDRTETDVEIQHAESVVAENRQAAATKDERRLRRAARAAGLLCPNCAEPGLPSLTEGAVCRLCGEEARDEFREGWDESD
jgi:hypothetical protein